MRFKYYIRLFRQMNIRKTFAFILILLITMVVLVILCINRISPVIEVACKSKAKAVALQITEETVKEFLNNVEYESLINLTYNSDGKIVGIHANIIQMNKLSSGIAYKIQDKLSNMDRVDVEIPLAKLMGINIFSGYGPSMKIKIVPFGNIITDFKTDFVSVGINQTRHTIYIDIVCAVNIIAPFNLDSVTTKSTVTVAETVIVGDIPGTYYNIEDIHGAAETGLLDAM